MDNRCFIIMPSGEPNGYAQGHFNRVYDYVIVPACRAAGYWPTRADIATYDNALEVVKTIVDSEIAICDLSANNSNALYGLAIRHALDLPVTLVKDVKSFVMFDVNDFGVVEYDDSLRIDTVQKTIDMLSEALKKAVETRKERHSLLNRLGIGLPQFTPPTIDTDLAVPAVAEKAEEQEEQKPKEPRLPIISPLPDYVGDPFTEAQIEKLKAGDFLFHLNHGKGKLNFIKNSGKEKLASIQFDAGTKLLVIGVSDFFRKVEA